MGDYSVTAASVLASPFAKRVGNNLAAPVSALAVSARPGVNTAGATITAGQPVYQGTDYAYYPADANGASPLYEVAGIAENSAAAGQPVSVVYEDPYFTPGITMAIGDIIILSVNAGGLCPAADLASGSFPVVLMVAYSTTQARLKLILGGVAKA